MNKTVDYSTKVLEVKNLKKHFKVGVGKNKLKVKAVDDVSFDIYKKEVFGLVGESGCGKTTTGRTIIRLYEPTNGIVKLENEIIGAGVNDFYRDIKYEKLSYQLNLLKLNQYKYDIYLLKEKFNKEKKVILKKIAKEKERYLNEEKEIKKDIYNYRDQRYEAKNDLEVAIENLTYSYNSQFEEIMSKSKNEFLIEYKSLVKGIKLAFNKKIEGIKDSAALSKEVKDQHIEELSISHDKKMQELDDSFSDKIAERNNTLTSKEECKKEIQVIKDDYLKKKKSLLSEYKDKVIYLQKPNYKKINEEKKIAYNQSKQIIADYNQEIADLKSKLNENIASVNSSKEVDKEKYDAIKLEHSEFLKEQNKLIKEARTAHKSKNAERHSKKIQMIFQDPISSLNPRMTVQEIVSEGLIINGEKNQEVIKAKVIEALKLVGLAPEYISRYPHEFSGGQRQRIGIARALIMDPSIIIADEPISALDVSIKAQVINLLSDLREELGLTILFVAHDLSVVKFFCDRVAVMYFGKMVELAPTEELFKNPFHGYTKSLLSAIPSPDPDSEKVRKRIEYSPHMHDYSVDKPEFVEVTPGHFVLANKSEVKAIKKELNNND